MSDFIYQFDLSSCSKNQLKWFNTYKNLIIKAKNRFCSSTNRKIVKSGLGYVEKHHILPRCMRWN